MGSNGHPFMDGKKRKGEGSLSVVLLSLSLMGLTFVSTDLVEKYTQLNKLELTQKSVKKELASSESKLAVLETRYEKITGEVAKLDTLLYRQSLQYDEVVKERDEFQSLYKTLFDKYQDRTLQCNRDDDINLDDINKRLNRIRGTD